MLSIVYLTPLSVAYPTFTNDIRRLSDGISVALPTARRLFFQKISPPSRICCRLTDALYLTDGYLGVA